MVAIVIIAMGEGEVDPAESESSLIEGFPVISIWVPIGLVVVNSVLHTSISVIGRYFLIKGAFPSFDFSMDSYILHSFGLMIAYIIYCQLYGALESELVWTVATGSIFCMSGFILYSEACVYGKAGPAQILMELQSVWQLILEIVLYSFIPGVTQICGMGIALFGSSLVAFEFEQCCKKTNKVK